MKNFILSTFLLVGLTTRAQQVTFTAATNYSTGTTGSAQGPLGVAIGDLNGDNRPDIVAGSYANKAVSVLLGQAGGGFGTAVLYPTGDASADFAPVNVIVADMNNDGRLDIVAGGYSTTTAVLLGQAGGGFAPYTLYSLSQGDIGLAVGDINRDGRLDIVRSGNERAGRGSVGVLLGQASGGFVESGTYATGGGGQDLALGDVNRDGLLDIVTVYSGASSSAGEVSVLLGVAGGGFTAATIYPVLPSPFDIALGDVSGDGYPDIVLTYASGTSFSSSNIGVMLGQSTGGFGPVVNYATGMYYTFSNIVLQDMNNDAKVDVVGGIYSQGFVGVVPGQGNGSFSPGYTYAMTAGAQPSMVAVGDVDGNGKPDIVASSQGSNSVNVFLNATVLATRAALPGVSATLWPNPATAAASLTLTGLPAAVARVQATLLDATGRAVAQQVLATGQGVSRAEVSTAGLAAGLYVLRLVANDVRGEEVGILPTQRLTVR